MDELKKLIEALGRAFEEFKAENDKRIKEIEKGKTEPVLAEKIDKINADISDIAVMKRQLEAVETAVARAQFTGGGAEKAQAQLRMKAFSHLMRRGAQDIKELEVQAAASTLSDPDGGFTVPEEVDKAIDRVAETIQAMRRLATVRTISTDTYKKLVSQGGVTSGWVAEREARTDETGTPTLAEIAINTKEIFAMPYASQQLLDDSAIDIGAWLAGEVSVEFNEKEGAAFITGNGVGEPKGIAAYTMVANANYAWGKVGYIASGHASLLNSADKLIDLQHALKPKYRNGAVWLMADSTMQVIRKFKDGEGNYLWRPGLLQDAPDTLLGKPVEYDDNVAAITNNTYSAFYGNFKRAYLIVERLGTRVLRDPYTAKPYVAFYTTKRVGGGIIMYEAIKALKIAAS